MCVTQVYLAMYSLEDSLELARDHLSPTVSYPYVRIRPLGTVRGTKFRGQYTGPLLFGLNDVDERSFRSFHACSLSLSPCLSGSL